MSVPLLNDAPIDQHMLINVLNVMYNENTRQIQQLNEANAEIRNVITTILYSRVNNDNNNNNNNNNNIHIPYRNAHTGNNRNSHTYHTNRNRNTHNHNNRNTTSASTSPSTSASTSPSTSASAYTANNSTVNNSNRRIYIDNIPFIIENIQRYNIPSRVVGSHTNSRASTSRPRTSDLASTIGNFLDPIVIYPTQTQIELATRNVRYCDIVTPINLSCPISLETFNDNDMVTVIRFCGHIFSTASLNTWFTTNCRCPVCRYDIRNYNSNNSLSNIQTLTSPVENNIESVIDTTPRAINNEPTMGINSALNSYLYGFINDDIDVSGNNNISDAEAFLSLITEIQRNIH